MEPLETILLEAGYQVCDDGFHHQAPVYRSHIQFQSHKDPTKVKMIIKRIYSQRELVLIEQVRNINQLTRSLTKILKTEPQLALSSHALSNRNHPTACHSGLFCSKCESIINQRVIYDVFESYPGFIGIMKMKHGQCVVSIDSSSARKITEKLVTLRNCKDCNNRTDIPIPRNTKTWTH